MSRLAKWICVFCLLNFVPSSWGQASESPLGRVGVDWSRWENATPEYKRTVWEQIPGRWTDLAMSASRHTRYKRDGLEPIDLIHVFDFSGDGIEDVIVEGQVMESEEFALFQNINGQYVNVFRGYGILTGLRRLDPWLPISFRLYNYGCCDDMRDFVEDYAPVLGDSLSFVLSGRAMVVKEMELPATRLADPVGFRIDRESYNLRLEPKIDDEPRDGPDGPNLPGNLIARYGKGTRGMALAEKDDGTGRIWWFVVVKAQEPPQWALHERHDGLNSKVPADRMGWMSSRYLEVVDPAGVKEEGLGTAIRPSR